MLLFFVFFLGRTTNFSFYIYVNFDMLMVYMDGDVFSLKSVFNEDFAFALEISFHVFLSFFLFVCISFLVHVIELPIFTYLFVLWTRKY